MHGFGVAVQHTECLSFSTRRGRQELGTGCARAASTLPGAPWLTVQDLRYDADPIIYGNILVQNNTDGAANFTPSDFPFPTTFAAPNLIRGSVNTSVIGIDGLISALPNFSIYSVRLISTPSKPCRTIHSRSRPHSRQSALPRSSVLIPIPLELPPASGFN